MLGYSRHALRDVTLAVPRAPLLRRRRDDRTAVEEEWVRDEIVEGNLQTLDWVVGQECVQVRGEREREGKRGSGKEDRVVRDVYRWALPEVREDNDDGRSPPEEATLNFARIFNLESWRGEWEKEKRRGRDGDEEASEYL